jgi:putative transcriptional regulator
MAVSYNKLWILLVDKKMSKADIRKYFGLFPNTMTKMRRDEPVMLNVPDKICYTSVCNYEIVMNYEPDKERSNNS